MCYKSVFEIVLLLAALLFLELFVGPTISL